jgi:O-antigen ligase
MTDVEVSRMPSLSVPRRHQGADHKVSRLNTLTFWALMVVLALAPIPFGSARALYWALLPLVFGSMTVLYFARLGWIGGRLRIGVGAFWPQASIWAISCLWLVVQLLPLGLGDIPLPDGTSIDASHISIAPGMTILMLCRQLGYGLFFLLVLQVAANEGRRKLLLDVLLCMIVAHGLYGMISLHSGDTILGLEKWAYNGYATGTFVNRNSYATFLAMGAIIAAGRICGVAAQGMKHHRDDGRPPNFFSNLLIYGVAYLFLLTVIFSTASRMGAAVTLIGTAVVFAVALRGTRSAVVLAVLVPVAGLALALYGPALVERFGEVEAAATVRNDFYRQIGDLILLRPLTGFGGGSFELAYPLVHADPVYKDAVWSLAHNTYLGLWAELGLVVGSLMILSVLLLTLRILFAALRHRGNPVVEAVALGVATACGLHALVDFSLEIPANTLVFLALMAAGAAATVTAKSKAK